MNLTRTGDPSSPFGHLNDNEKEITDSDTAYDPAYPDEGFVDDVWPRDMATMVICIPDLLKRSMIRKKVSNAVYIHDLSHLSGVPVFMGGAIARGDDTGREYTFLDEVELDQLHSPSQYQELKYQDNVEAANRVWTVTVVASEGTYQPEIGFIILGGALIFGFSIILALWVYRAKVRQKQPRKDD